MNRSSLEFALRVGRQYPFYVRSGRWGKQQYEAYQDERLRQVVRHAAAHVPYYRKLFGDIGLDPAKFQGRADMHLIPLLDKQTLRTRQKEFIADNAEQYGINWDTTSGSTGTPLRLIIDHATKAHKLAAVLHAYRWAGYFPGKRIFSIQSYTFEDPEAISRQYPMARMWRFNSRLLKKDTALAILVMINRIRPQVLIGYPFSMLMIAQIARENGIGINPVQSIITAGETLSAKRRHLLQEAYGGRAHDFFSHHEDVAVISECPHGCRHIFENFAYNEVVDEQDRTAASGTGRLVGTGFYNYAMPLIRYNVGDNVVFDGEDRQCPCGSRFRAVEEIIGRQNDYLETPDGRFLGNVLEHAVDKAEGVRLSQCVQDAVDHIYVNMIVDGTFAEESTRAFEEGLRLRLGNEIRIDFRVVDQLEKTGSGKTPFILSKIGHTYI